MRADTEALSASPRLAALAPALLCFAAVGLVARSDGGWWPTTWGWAAIGLLFVAAAGLIVLPALPAGRLDLAYVGALAALTAWTGLSWLWSESAPRTALELERGVVYPAAALALLVVTRRRSVPAGLGGLLAADVAVCGHALATRLVPDRVTWAGSSVAFRLAGVFGYPNALGIAAVMGLLLALAFAADGAHPAARAAAAAAAVPLGLALYFANSRGSWAALAAGLAATAALSPRRRSLARAAAAPAAGVGLAAWLASRSAPLTRWTDPLAAAHDGHRLALAAAGLAAAAALATLPVRRAAAGAAVLAAAAVLVAPAGPASALAAGPGGAPPPGTTPGERLFSTNTNSRTHYWRVAFDDFRRHPVAGSGAGTFVREWYRHRTIRADVTDAHSLYLETLAELGLAGLALVLAVLAVPSFAALRARGTPLVAGAFGAFAAFAAHAAVDWDWELPGVTLGALFLGGLLAAAARADERMVALDRRWRTPLLVPVLAALAFSLVGLVGNRAEAGALAAARRGDWASAAAEARKASGWAPWSAEALALESDAAGRLGDRGAQLGLLRRAIARDPAAFELWGRLATLATGPERRLARQRAAELDPLG